MRNGSYCLIGVLWLLLRNVVAEDKSYFGHGARLVCVHTVRAKSETGRGVDCVDPRKVAANEETAVLKGRCKGERRARATRSEYQVDRILRSASGTSDIF